MLALRSPAGAAAIVVALLLASAASQEAQKRQLQDGAKVEQHEAMVADKHGQYGPADGGGSARVVEAPPSPPLAGTAARYVLEYKAGELGIAAGGGLFFQVSPFWGWSTPQVEAPEVAGFTQVATSASGVRLEASTIAPQCLLIRIDDAPLPADATITIRYGEGMGARVDSYAEDAEAFYFWVDGDGDGTRKLIGSDPHVAIAPGPAADFVLHAPSEVATGATFDVTLAFLDIVANVATGFEGEVELAGEGLELPPKVSFTAAQRGRQRVPAKALAPGIRRVTARFADATRASNPIFVTDAPRRVLWADLHGHSQLSDGTGTPEEYYEYARDVAALDVGVLTDHDHWGMRKLDQDPAMWARICATTAQFDAPGRFTTLIGYEWTNWLYGHRHVLYFGSTGDVISSLDPPTDTPEGLWAALKAKKAKAITVPHHPAGGPVPIDWSFAPDPELEPVVEIVSVHGSSEEPRGPRGIYAPVKGHYVRDALAKGYRLGFVGSGDSHNGHPGLVHLGSPSGGLAAIVATDNTRDALHAALMARTCWATSGARILLWFRLGATRMGAIAPRPADGAKAADAADAANAAEAAEPPYFGFAIGEDALASLELIKNGVVVARVDGNGSIQRSLEWHDPARKSGDWVYLRVIQEDGHAAWSSPIFTD